MPEPMKGSTAKPEPTEGWGVIRPGDRVAHYYREGTSLCRKVGFYRGPLDDNAGLETKEDCTPCRRKLDKEGVKRR